MRISDWSSDVCSSDLIAVEPRRRGGNTEGSRAALASPEVSEWTSRPLQRLRLLAQDELLDLAGGGLGQRAEDHFLRRLEAGEALAAEGDELGLVGLLAGLQLDQGARGPAPFLARPRAHRDSGHRRVAAERATGRAWRRERVCENVEDSV